MANWEHVHNLMEEVGAHLDADQVTEFPDEGFWYVALDDDTEIGVHYDPTADRIVLILPVGRPTEGARRTSYDALLAYNGQWQGTGSIRMGLDEPGGEVVMIADVTAAGLTGTDFATVLADLRDKGRTWREFLAQVGGTGELTEGRPFGDPNAIRV